MEQYQSDNWRHWIISIQWKLVMAMIRRFEILEIVKRISNENDDLEK